VCLIDVKKMIFLLTKVFRSIKYLFFDSDANCFDPLRKDSSGFKFDL